MDRSIAICGGLAVPVTEVGTHGSVDRAEDQFWDWAEGSIEGSTRPMSLHARACSTMADWSGRGK